VGFSWVNLVVGLSAAVLAGWAHSRVMHGSTDGVPTLLMVQSGAQLLAHLALATATLSALVALRALPAWAGVGGVVRWALGLTVLDALSPFGAMAITAWVARRSPNPSSLMMVSVGLNWVGVFVQTAALLGFAWTLERLVRRRDSTVAVRLVPWVGLAFAIGLMSLARNSLTWMLAAWGVGLWVPPMALSAALSAVQVWGWTRGLRAVAALVEAQPMLSSAQGPDDTRASG